MKFLTLDVVSCSTLIHNFYKNGCLKEACQLLRRMKKLKIAPTIATYNILIYAFSNKLKIHMATKVFHEMVKKGSILDVFTYSVLVDGFCKTGNIDSSFYFLIEKLKELIPPTITFGRVINCLCNSYRVQEAVCILYTMVNKGIVLDVFESIFEVDKREVVKV